MYTHTSGFIHEKVIWLHRPEPRSGQMSDLATGDFGSGVGSSTYSIVSNFSGEGQYSIAINPRMATAPARKQ